MKGRLAISLPIVLMLFGCGKGSPLTPRSSGGAYEVTVVGDEEGDVAAALKTAVEGLPQEEPCFDVRHIRNEDYGLAAQTARNLIIVQMDTTLRETGMHYEKNAMANPQLVVYISAPTARQLHADVHKWSRPLRELLTRHEMNIAIDRLKNDNNTDAAARVKRLTGATIMIPTDLKAVKEGKDFLWLSNNTNSGMQSLCIYSYPEGTDFVKARDSIMQANIKGETDKMYMNTVAGSVKTETVTERGTRRQLFRGLWEMKHDAMGGPFVAHVISDTARRRVIVAEAFVYAPEMRKRNKLKQIEAALYTLYATEKNQP